MTDKDVNSEHSDDDTVVGSAGRDTFVFTPGHGNDTIIGFTDGEDLIDLSAFSGIAGLQNLAITSDDDAVTIDLTEYGGGTIRLEGFDIDDLDSSDFVFAPIEATDGNDQIIGGVDGDVISGLAGNDRIFGAAGSDSIDGGEGDDEIYGGSGADWIWGNDGNDTIHGGEGDDRIEGGLGDDTIKGGLGDDWLGGGSGADEIRGGEGDDTLVGDAGDDTLYGDAGDDTLYGEDGDDWVHGGAGDDSIYGDAGDDKLIGGEGDDRIDGGEGADWIEGQAGDDTLLGGGGADTFVFSPGGGNDTIKDFTDGEDLIELSAFTGVTGVGDLTMTADGDDVVIDLTAYGGGTIRLENTALGDLDAEDFNFDEPLMDPGLEGL